MAHLWQRFYEERIITGKAAELLRPRRARRAELFVGAARDGLTPRACADVAVTVANQFSAQAKRATIDFLDTFRY